MGTSTRRRWQRAMYCLSFGAVGCGGAGSRNAGVVQDSPGIACSALEVEALTRQAILTGDVTNVIEGDEVGVSVAISGDRVLLGAPSDTVTALEGGAAHVFRRVGAEWVLDAKLGPPESDQVSIAQFGSRVALEGNRAVVGAPSDQGPERGAAYVFDYDESEETWVRVARLAASDGVGQDEFGAALSLEGGRVAVGAPRKSWSTDGVYVSSMGAVYLFEEQGGSFAEVSRLRATEEILSENFGSAVALQGSSLLVGAMGAVYVFARDADSGAWTQEQRLTPSDEAIGRGFGASLSMSGDRAVVGARWAGMGTSPAGAAFVLERQAGAWTETAELSPSVSMREDFGIAVAIDGERAVVGALRVGEAGNGATFVFLANSGAWSETARIDPPGGAGLAISGERILAGGGSSGVPGAGGAFLFEGSPTSLTRTWSFGREGGVEDHFAAALAVSGMRVLVGASGAGGGAGAAYVFQPVNGAWQRIEKLVPVANGGGEFGKSVALGPDHALVGSPARGAGPGKVFAYDLNGAGWESPTALAAQNGVDGMQFGAALALDGDRAAIGAPRDGDGATPTGAVYVFEHGALGWSEAARLVVAEPVPLGALGNLVALRGDTLLAGASFLFEGPGVAVFERRDERWEWRARLALDEITGGRAFAVALSGERAFVAGPMIFADGSTGSGVYVFERAGDGFALIDRWTASDGAGLGGALAVSGNRALVGAPGYHGAAVGSGAAYLFEPELDGSVVETRFDTTPAEAFLGFGTSLGWSEQVLAVAGPGSDVAGQVWLYGSCSSD